MADIRVGVIGAGANTRLHHIPKLQAIAGVEVVSVCNRSRESSERVAREFGIPKVYDHWTDLVAADDTNAIVIGTWPYLHCPVTLAALDAGKHVLTEARMAMNAGEAHAMLEASRQCPQLIAQIVPSPFSFKADRTLRDLLAEGFVGELLAIELKGGSAGFADFDRPRTWRQNRELSGFNLMLMGIWYEALMRWVGHATRVTAVARTFVNRRPDESGARVGVEIPDHVDVIAEMACGAQAHLQFTEVCGLSRQDEVWFDGTTGTLRYDRATQRVDGGQRGDRELTEISIAPEKEYSWRVEEEFVRAVRGEMLVWRTSFADGVKYMEFTEAVVRSAQAGRAVPLPLSGH